MFRLAIALFLLGVGAACVGFGAAGTYAWEGGKVLFLICMALSVMALLRALYMSES